MSKLIPFIDQRRVEHELDRITETVDHVLSDHSLGSLLADSQSNMAAFCGVLDGLSDNDGAAFIRNLIGALAVTTPPEKWQMCLDAAATYPKQGVPRC